MRSADLHAPMGRVLPVLLLPLLALAIIWPLLRHGPSCGHDFGFHLQSWMDAGAQMRQGTLLPRWADSPAFNAGEPRFLFYPPLSWLLGSLLLLTLPAQWVPAAFTWLALAGAAASMYGLARRFTGPAASLVAAAVYVANPYMLFTALERTAYGELLAAAWMPLLFRAALSGEADGVQADGVRRALHPLNLAVAVALLWLTNAPAAVMGTYALVALVGLRLALRPTDRQHGWRLVGLAGMGLVLGLGLSGFYLVPAALERRYVQIAMAIIPNMRVEDNFLFGHTGYGPHDAVLRTASRVALLTAALAAVLLAAGRWRTRRPGCADAGEGALGGPTLRAGVPSGGSRAGLPAILTAMTGLILLLLWRGSLPVWQWLPEMTFLQFPWRLLSVLGCVLGIATALAFQGSGAGVPGSVAVLVAVGVAALGGAVGIRSFREVCEARELPVARMERFRSHHGVGPTDEYTPLEADNDQLRWDDPAWWLTNVADAPGPGTVPNPAATIPDYDQPPPMEQTVAGFAPRHLALQLQRPADLVLNLRDYPAWKVTLNGETNPKRLQRDDGLLALELPAGDDVVEIRWQTLPDVWAGAGLTAVSLLGAGALLHGSRRIKGLSDAS